MWLTSFEPNRLWSPTEVALLRRVQIGERTDHAWASLDPPVVLVDEPVELVILGARHEGFDVWHPTAWPVHVFVCTVPPEHQAQDVFTRDEVIIARWGLLHESTERAEIDEF